jgi:pyruvate,water dikinase
VLQSRPITTLHGRHLYSSRLVSEMMPGLIKPLLWSTSVADMMSNVFVRIFRNLSGDGRIDAFSLVRRFHSRIYADMSRFGELLEQLGLPANFFEMVTRDELSQRGRLRINGHLLRSVPRMALFVARYGRIRQRAGRFIRFHDRRLDLYRRQDWSARGPEELLERSQALRTYHGQTQWTMWIAAINLMARRKLLSRFLGRHVPEVSAAELLSGLVKLKSLEPNRRLMNMASRARRLAPEDLQALLQDDDRAIRSRLRRTTPGRALAAEFDDLMERYGFLSSSGTDFTVSPWSEQPEILWRAIGQLTATATGNGRARASGIRGRAERRVHDRLNWFQRRRFRHLLRSTRRHVRLRERISLFMSEDVAHMRGLYLALGRRLARDGRLATPDDLFYLYFRELARLVDGSADEDLLRQKILKRKKTLQADAAVDAEDLFYGPPCLWRPPGGEIPAPYLEGIAGSHGRIRGFARIVRDPQEVSAPLCKQDILVVPHTDVGWTPLFPGIGGLVSETGGQLSHSSIVAREYGLPAVVSVRNATRIIRGGQPVTVDGDRGRVYLKHVPSGEEAAR